MRAHDWVSKVEQPVTVKTDGVKTHEQLEGQAMSVKTEEEEEGREKDGEPEEGMKEDKNDCRSVEVRTHEI